MNRLTLFSAVILSALLLSHSSQADVVFSCSARYGASAYANFDFLKYKAGKIGLLKALWKSKNGQTMRTVLNFKVDELHALEPSEIEGSTAITFKLNDPASGDIFVFTTMPSITSERITTQSEIANGNAFTFKAKVLNSRNADWGADVFECKPKKTKFGF